MEAQPQVRAADDPRIVLGLEPSGAQLHAAGWQPGEAAFELGTAGPIAGDQHHQIWKAPPRRCRLPPADALLESRDGIDDQIEILVFGPTRRAHDKADNTGMHAESREQRLTEPFALRPLDGRERRSGTVVQHTRVLHAEPAFQESREAARDREVGVSTARIAPLEPAREPDRRVPLSQV